MITHVQVQVLSLAPKSSGYGAVGSALVWGARGREFKSRYSDQPGLFAPVFLFGFQARRFFFFRFNLFTLNRLFSPFAVTISVYARRLHGSPLYTDTFF